MSRIDHNMIMMKIEKGYTRENGCHTWNMYMGRKEYPSPQCKHNRKYLSVRRYIWNLSNDVLKQGQVLTQTCNNQKCVNIDHLKIKCDINWEYQWNKLLGRSYEKNGCIIIPPFDELTGYARATLRGNPLSAHRLSYMIKIRSEHIPSTINGEVTHIRHTCNKRSCVNPIHLELGTASENMNDKGLPQKNTEEWKKNKRIKYKINQEKILTPEQFEQAGVQLYKNVNKKIMDIGADYGECWVFTGYVSKETGYGKISFFARNRYAHVWSNEIKEKRAQRKGEVTRHICTTKSCINPNHLCFGSQKDNSIDFILKGSRVSKLNADSVREIRSSSESDESLSKKYSVGKRAIYNVRNGKTWKYIE